MLYSLEVNNVITYDDVWITTAVEIAKVYRDPFFDQTLKDISARGLSTGGTGFAPIEADNAGS